MVLCIDLPKDTSTCKVAQIDIEKRFTLHHHDKILYLIPIWKVFAGYLDAGYIKKNLYKWVENVLGKAENSGNQHFLLFP